ncbi:cytochrome d ubiquinol oxidase subunit II [Gilvimarinus agarilyticus]|uniref:cytochrome d ubiquinol oxidase subunit II n=1 Tax=Gilvimarinus sp. 2_MG-2023 TaxID=3062666 RepID=UPI001C091EAA|nr:cytochrome d ubiquinol oxidase subunit II [Gilvimarinus sp. 2_MG-2023]MBU2884294.1 cytochrome d ubiquinol oxidase subunit II [Gilvimarinus agarilyticus]MDO6569432.1 cytochrome d ubiquinol oxidase subunit II [Gilvimarinus sp. 2_MG-2023]
MSEDIVLTGWDYWLPVIFIGLMGLSFFIYAVLDGYDLGVGILLPMDAKAATKDERDTMIASIGPFWDANETWLVLAVGLLLIAFPSANALILGQLYLPALVLLLGLILRGVAFDFRAKSPSEHKRRWDWVFKTGSMLATFSQGVMIGLYVVGFEYNTLSIAFALLSGVCVSAGYCFIGAAWLVMKTEHDLQRRAANWARTMLWVTLLGLALISIVNPWANPDVYGKWFGFPQFFILLLVPLSIFVISVVTELYLRDFPRTGERWCWLPFAGAVVLFLLSFLGLGYSFFPDIVPGQLTVWQAAADSSALIPIGLGAVIVVPVILIYTAYAYRVFWGKATELKYH